MSRSEARWPDCASGFHARCGSPDRCGCPCHVRPDPTEQVDVVPVAIVPLPALRALVELADSLLEDLYEIGTFEPAEKVAARAVLEARVAELGIPNLADL